MSDASAKREIYLISDCHTTQRVVESVFNTTVECLLPGKSAEGTGRVMTREGVVRCIEDRIAPHRFLIEMSGKRTVFIVVESFQEQRSRQGSLWPMVVVCAIRNAGHSILYEYRDAFLGPVETMVKAVQDAERGLTEANFLAVAMVDNPLRLLGWYGSRRPLLWRAVSIVDRCTSQQEGEYFCIVGLGLTGMLLGTLIAQQKDMLFVPLLREEKQQQDFDEQRDQQQQRYQDFDEQRDQQQQQQTNKQHEETELAGGVAFMHSEAVKQLFETQKERHCILVGDCMGDGASICEAIATLRALCSVVVVHVLVLHDDETKRDTWKSKMRALEPDTKVHFIL